MKAMDDSTGKVTGEKATTSKLSISVAPKIVTLNKDENDVAKIDTKCVTLIRQNHNNSTPDINYSTDMKVKQNDAEIQKLSIKSTANNTAHSDRMEKIDEFEDYPPKNDGNIKGSKKLMDTVMTDTKSIPKLWQVGSNGAKEQYHHEYMTCMVQNGYTPAYVQMTASSMIQQQVAETATVGFEMRRGKPCYWKGELPPRNYCNPVFSSKVFVGGVPWDITEQALLDSFSNYGSCRVEWPSKESRHTRTSPRRAKVTGYVYMIFENDWAVKRLLQDCSQEFGTAGEWYFQLAARRASGLEIRQVQVIPWVVTDASFIITPNIPLDPKKTVFVGALHGMITAQVLFFIMRDVYGDVLFVGIDTDRQKYPIGSARVTFATQSAYLRAIESGYLEIRTSKFTKKIQIDPFLEDAKCSQCECVQGPYFCREKSCFKYFCLQCWEVRHALTGPYGGHKPMIRTHRRSLHSESYITCGATNCAVSYDPRTVVSRQYFGTIAPGMGIQMNIRPSGPDHITEISKPTNMNVTFTQPTYLWPSYPNQAIKQVQVWVPTANQPGVIQHENSLKPQPLSSFRRIPCISSSSAGSHHGQYHTHSLIRLEKVVDGTLSAASVSSSAPSSETISSNPSP